MICGKLGSPRKAARSLKQSVCQLAENNGRKGNRLSHPHHGLASHALSTLEIHLLLRKKDGAPGESALLQDPATAIQRPLEHMGVKVVDSLADVEWCIGSSSHQGHTVSGLEWLQEAILLVFGTTACEDTVCATVDLLHALCFLVEVAAFALHNAYRVDPEISTARESSRYRDGILKCTGKACKRNAALVLLECMDCRAEMSVKVWTPLMRERHPFACILGPRLDEADSVAAF